MNLPEFANVAVPHRPNPVLVCIDVPDLAAFQVTVLVGWQVGVGPAASIVAVVHEQSP